MRKIGLAVAIAVLLMFAVISNPVLGQAPPPPPPPPGGTVGPPCPPQGCPTNAPTVTPTPTVTATSTPTATATAVPCFATLKLKHSSVKVGTKQSATAKTLAGARVKITVTYPNKKKQSKTGNADQHGTFVWNWHQPKNKTTKSSTTASVSAKATCAGQPAVTSSKKKYKIT
jgi:hypothetical protein